LKSDSKIDEIALPSFKRPDSGWWFTTIGAIVAIALIIAPKSVNFSLAARITLVLVFIFLPAVWASLAFAVSSFTQMVRRSFAYPRVYETVSSITMELEQSKLLINALMLERENHRSLTVAYCFMFRDSACISLNRKRGFRVKTGDRCTVVDQENGQVLGRFVVIEVRPESYIARAEDHVDPIWLGYMRQAGTAHSSAPPNAAAIFIQLIGESDDEGT